MTMGVIGRKAGMTRIFTEEGVTVPVTVIEVQTNRIARVKTEDNDGYRAVQVTVGSRKASRVNKPAAGHFRKAGVEAGNMLGEFRLDAGEGGEFAAGQEIKVDRFAVGQKVDVRGVSKGRGVAGGIRRHNFRGQDNSHGNSISHRAPGSIGQCQTPGRVFKGKRMAGRMGNVNRCQQNLKIVQVDADRNLLLVKGGVPGPVGGRLIVVPSVKHKN